MKLNIGSGAKAAEGYLNFDYSPNVILSRFPFLKALGKSFGILKPEHMTTWDRRVRYKDARKIRYPDNSIEAIYSSHFLEHVFFWQAQAFLDSSYRMLNKGGTIRLALPDYKEIAKEFVENYARDPYLASLEFNQNLLSYPLKKSDLFGFLLNSKFGHVHRWHPTEGLVSEMLKISGFRDIRSQTFQKGQFPDLEIIEERDTSTFYLEATK